MSRSGLARLWAIIGALLALYAIGTLIILQGGKSFADLPGLEARAPVTSAYEAVPIVGTLLGILSIIGLLHVRKVDGMYEMLLPVVAVGDVGPHKISSWSMRFYQGFFFAMFIIAPATALYKLNTAVLQRGVLWHEGAPAQNTIALKNAFVPTRGESLDDSKENASWRERPPRDGFTWLANTRCDIVKWSRPNKPIALDGKAQADDPVSAVPIVTQKGAPDVCINVQDLSEICEGSKRQCRGIQWIPILSPALLAVPTLFGLVSATLLFLVSAYRKFRQIEARVASRERA